MGRVRTGEVLTVSREDATKEKRLRWHWDLSTESPAQSSTTYAKTRMCQAT